MKKLFYLNQNFLRDELKKNNYEEFRENFSTKLNINNVTKWNNKKILKYVDTTNFDNYIAYIFELFNLWLNQNERFTKNFLMDLEIIISKLNLWKYFYQTEINYIEHIFNVVFAKNRVLKDIIVDFEVQNNEKVYFNYDVGFVIQQHSNYSFKKIFHNSNIYLTTKRIAIANKFEYLSIYFEEIENVTLHEEYIKIRTNNRDFLIYSFDVFLIYISLERLGKVLNKYL